MQTTDNRPVYLPDASHYCASPDWRVLSGDPRFCGAIVKATEGVSYRQAEWFLKQWPALREAGQDRYGQSWFRGAYHYLIFHDDPARQAEYFANTVGRADPDFTWGEGEIFPVVDVERGGAQSPNWQCDQAQVLDCVTGFVERLKQLTGNRVMLYGHEAMLHLGIRDQMGCDWLWIPSYEKKMSDPNRIGWNEPQVLLWQYTDGVVNKTSHPTKASGLASADLSLVLGPAAANLHLLSCRSANR